MAKQPSSTLTKLLWGVFIVPLVLFVIPTAFEFFGVPKDTYSVYVAWFIGILLLNIFLVPNVPNIFATSGSETS
tara:strand:- start:5921 stop:6142 length:222 start_codon:yes stop_codon:yes gene_type:complete